MIQIESLLSARLFLEPQRVVERLYFLSNLSGRLSLYAMDFGGSVPEPLLPADIALQNPALMNGYSFCVFSSLGKILVMMDRAGDENYQPMWVPLEGGVPQPAFGGELAGFRVHMERCYPEDNIVYLAAESRQEPLVTAYQVYLDSGDALVEMAKSPWAGLGKRGGYVNAVNEDHKRAVILERYSVGDDVLYLWDKERGEPELLLGKPMEARGEGAQVPRNAIVNCHFTEKDTGLVFLTALFDDCYGLGYLDLDSRSEPAPITVEGLVHEGQGELHQLEHLKDDHYLLRYNIDGCSWGYEGRFDEANLKMTLNRVVWGQGELSNGALQSVCYEQEADGYALAFSSATSPVQIYTLDGRDRDRLTVHTRERVLGIPKDRLSPGEDASYESFDDVRVSALLYFPSVALGFKGPRPLVYYLHGGPHSQERPDFTWFSMPLIQYLTMHGFAVFVPNVRGSTGYGLAFTKHVDRDWGGQDRLDHVHAMKILTEESRIDTKRAGVVGRSYGGYMSLILAGQHPELWSAAVDMFGPYDLITFSERIPPTWKPYYKVALGDPEDAEDREFLRERSPKTHLHQLLCPLLVIQGANDPRVVERESRDLVGELRDQGKDIEYLVFEDEGHDVLKFDNRVRCYNTITEFLVQHLQP